MVQDSVAAAVQKAYLSNSLPDLMHSITTYTYQSAKCETGSQEFALSFTFSGTSYEKFLFCFTRDADLNAINAATLSNFVGGIQYMLVTVNGQNFPALRYDTDKHVYELFRRTSYSYGQKQHNNNNVKLPSRFLQAAGGGTTAAVTATNGVVCRTGNDLHIGDYNPYVGVSNPDSWNAPPAAFVNANYTARMQGCTVFVVSFSDKNVFKGENLKAGTAIRGSDTYINVSFAANIVCALTCHLFAIQDGILILKGTSAALLT